MLPPGFITGRSVHIKFDNSDDKQQTLTGAQTTHHTTGTIFQTAHVDDNPTGATSEQEQYSIISQEEPD